jgi:hypothetical protein
MSSASNEVRKFVKKARDAGVDIRPPDGAGHWAVWHKGRRVSSIPCSPSDFRWKLNAIADIWRYTGVDLKPEHHRRTKTRVS